MNKIRKELINKFIPAVAVLIFWIIVWVLVDIFIDHNKVSFAGPIDTLKVFVDIVGNRTFWNSCFFTFAGISGGYLIALVIGTILGYLAHFKPIIGKLFNPFFSFLGYIPMISFTIAAAIWFGGENTFITVSVFLALPPIYKNTNIALNNFNQHYIERIHELHIPMNKRVNYLYRPSMMPDYIIGCHRGLSMCWKSGIIAQYITNNSISIGEHLHTARLANDIASVFCWTIVIVLMCRLLEFLVLQLLSSKFINHFETNIEEIYNIIEDETTDF